MKIIESRLRRIIKKALISEMPVTKSGSYFSRDIDTRRPELQSLAEEVDSIFQEWDIDGTVELFDSGYHGISIEFRDFDGIDQDWIIVDQPGKVGLEDQSMGYIFFGPGGKGIQKSNAWIWEQVPYFGRKFGDPSMRDDVRQQTYNAIIDTIDDMIRSIEMGSDVNEGIDAVDTETGEIITFKDDNDDGWEPSAPEAAWPDLVKRLGLTPEYDGEHEGDHSYGLSGEDWTKLRDEVHGKQGDRQLKKQAAQRAADKERLDIDNLMDRARKWAEVASQDYMADNKEFPDTHLQDVAWDLASAAKYEFEEDEWDELIWHFDDDERQVIEFVADSMG